MIYIAHRGNLLGPSPEDENKPAHIEYALLEVGIDVEIDVWQINGKYYLGHDGPETPVGINFLTRDGLWCHAKNIQALAGLQELGCHTFFHDTDDATLTSRGFLWTFPGKELTRFSIAVLPERFIDFGRAKTILNDWDEVEAFQAKHLKPIDHTDDNEPIYSSTDMSALIKEINVYMPDDEVPTGSYSACKMAAGICSDYISDWIF